MAFSENRVQKPAIIGGVFRHTFTYNGDKKIVRVHPLCNCIKSNIKDPSYTFWYKIKDSSLKVIVIHYADDTRDFLEMQAIL